MQRQAVIDLNRLHLCFQKIIHDRERYRPQNYQPVALP
jgi:hypothetical protein